MSSTKAMVIAFDHQKIASFPQFRSALSNNSIEGWLNWIYQYLLILLVSPTVCCNRNCDFLDASEVKPFIENNDLDLHFFGLSFIFSKNCAHFFGRQAVTKWLFK